MLAFFQTLVPFAAVCVLCLFVARHTKVPAAMAPLPVMSGIMIFIVLGGYLGFLKPAVALVFCAAAAAASYMIVTRKRGGFRALFTPGLMIFFASSLVFIGYFALRQPVIQGWDEFSLWGTAAKLTKEYNMIYSGAPIDWPWIGTQKPGLPTLAYFFNFFGAYAAWRIYAAYGILFAAVWAAFAGTMRWKHWKTLVPLALFSFLLPYFAVYTRDIYCNYTYFSAYADIPMGIFMAGMFAWYYHAKEKNISLWPLCLMMAAIALMKDTGLALGCIVAGIVFVDLVFAGSEPKLCAVKPIAKKFGFFLAMCASAGAIFIASSRYLATLSALRINAAPTVTNSVGGVSGLGYGAMLTEGIKMLLGLAPGAAGAPYAEKFDIIRTEMISLFLPGEYHQISMVGCGLYVLLAVWAILLFTAVCTKDKKHRRSTLLYGVFSTLGFFAYYIFIGFTYVYVFKAEGTAAIKDYNRYFSTYYIAWFGGAAVLLAIGACKANRFKNILVLGMLSLSLAFLLRFNQLVQRQLCVIDYPEVVFNEPKALAHEVDAVKQQISAADRVYYVNSGDNGYEWFATSYEMIPATLLYSHGGGDFADAVRSESAPAQHISMEEWAAELAKTKCAYVYLAAPSAHFLKGYEALFSDGGAAVKEGKTLLYRVEIEGAPQYAPVTADDVLSDNDLRPDGTVMDWFEKENLPARTQRVKMINAQQHVRLYPVDMEVPQ